MTGQAAQRSEGRYRGDTLGDLLGLKVTAADQSDREQVAALVEEVQGVTDSIAELAYVDQGHPGLNAVEAAKQHGIARSGQTFHG